jgi:hypothetical protein
LRVARLHGLAQAGVALENALAYSELKRQEAMLGKLQVGCHAGWPNPMHGSRTGTAVLIGQPRPCGSPMLSGM